MNIIDTLFGWLKGPNRVSDATLQAMIPFLGAIVRKAGIQGLYVYFECKAYTGSVRAEPLYERPVEAMTVRAIAANVKDMCELHGVEPMKVVIEMTADKYEIVIF